MRRPYEIWKKYRQLQKKCFEHELKMRTARCPGNCTFNQVLYFNEARADVQLCTYGQHKPGEGEKIDAAKLVVCSKVAQAVACPYYCARYKDKQAVASAMAEEMKDPEARRKKFPDVEALRWVIEQDLYAFRQFPPNVWTKVAFRLIVWLEMLVKKLNKPLNMTDPAKNEDGGPVE